MHIGVSSNIFYLRNKHIIYILFTKCAYVVTIDEHVSKMDENEIPSLV